MMMHRHIGADVYKRSLLRTQVKRYSVIHFTDHHLKTDIQEKHQD